MKLKSLELHRDNDAAIALPREWLGTGIAGPEKLQQRRLAFLSARRSSAKSKQAEEAAQCTINLLAKSPAVGSAGLEVVPQRDG